MQWSTITQGGIFVGILDATKYWGLTQNHCKVTAPCHKKFTCVWEKWKQEEKMNWDEEIYCFSKEFCVTRTTFVLQEEISCHRNINISCHMMTIPVTGRNSLSQEEICWHRKKFLVTGWFPVTGKKSCINNKSKAKLWIRIARLCAKFLTLPYLMLTITPLVCSIKNL